MADEEVEDQKSGNILMILLIAGGAVLLLVIGLGLGFLIFGGQQSDPSEEVEQIIERTNPEAAARAKAAEKAEESEAGEGEEGEETGPPQKIAKISPEVEVFQTTYYEFPGNLTTNLKDSRKFLQVGIGVSTQYDDTVMDNVDSHQLALRSEILGTLSEFTQEDVQGRDGRQRLLDALRDAMNAKLEELEGFGGIEDVHFTSFVLQ
jgi:flagellar FliL protein